MYYKKTHVVFFVFHFMQLWVLFILFLKNVIKLVFSSFLTCGSREAGQNFKNRTLWTCLLVSSNLNIKLWKLSLGLLRHFLWSVFSFENFIKEEDIWGSNSQLKIFFAIFKLFLDGKIWKNDFQIRPVFHVKNWKTLLLT